MIYNLQSVYQILIALTKVGAYNDDTKKRK